MLSVMSMDNQLGQVCYLGFKDTFPGITQSSVREPNVPGVSKA